MTVGAGAADRPRVSAAGNAPRGRFWEIDAARTLAIAMMVAYHTVYDVEMLAPGAGPDPFRGFWGAVPEATGSLFLFVAGVSLAVSDARLERRGATPTTRLRRHLRHALIVFGAGMLVTVATRVVFGEQFVRFGILHLIGVSIVIAAFTVRLGWWNAILGAAALAGGLAIGGADGRFPGSSVIGLETGGPGSVDYWPVLPWIGPLLIGVAAGAMLYPRGTRRPLLDGLAGAREAGRALLAPGRRSLAVYLVHQIVLIPVVWIVLVTAGQDVPWPL